MPTSAPNTELPTRNNDPIVPSPVIVPTSAPNTELPTRNNDPIVPSPVTVPSSAPISENGNDNVVIDDNSLYNLIVANVPDGGASLRDQSSPQSAALNWLQNPINENYSDSRLLQRYALATLYYATNPNNNSWKSTSSWLSDTNECDWYSTSEPSSDVCTTTPNSAVYKELDLRGNGLQGEIPEEISLLTDLDTIRLSDNVLTGSIPWHVSTLTRLEYLDLSSNQLGNGGGLVGFAGNQIQSENGSVDGDSTTSTTGSDTSNNIFAETDVEASNPFTSFMYELGTMQSLAHFDISDNTFTSMTPVAMWGEGSPLSSTLKVLDLGSNQFFGTLPTEIGFLTKLTGLSVFNNVLTGQLPASISRMPLELLYVDSNEFASTSQLPGVPQAICGTLRPEPLREFWADCQEISCSCCTTCCTEEVGCITA